MVGRVQLSVREEERRLVEHWGGEGAGHEGGEREAFGTGVPNDFAERSSWLVTTAGVVVA